MAKAATKTKEASSSQVPRLREKFEADVLKMVKDEYKLSSPMGVPRLEKIVVNMGIGEALDNKRALDNAVNDLQQITGQTPTKTRAKLSISSFKLREGNEIGCRVTLRRDRMWEFLDRLINVALPRVRDFKGVSQKSFDGRGNYNLGITEQIVFPEIRYDKVDKIRGMNITMVMTGESDELSRAVLAGLGMPFRQ